MGVGGGGNLGNASGTITIGYNGSGVRNARNDLDNFQQQSEKAGQSFQTMSQGLAAGALVIAGGLAFAANKAIEFEKGISAIGAVSGASKAELESLRKKALQLGADTAFSATEAAQAMEELAKAGIPIADILNGAADATVALAAATGLDMPTAATIAADAMAMFSIKAKDMAKVVDIFAGAANASSIDVAELALSMKYVGPIAAAMGMDIEQASVAIALLGKNGIKADSAGTALRSMLTRLQPASKKAERAMEDLGLITANGSNQFFTAEGKLKNFSDIIEILRGSLSKLNPQQQQFALNTIFGAEAVSGVTSLLKEGAAGYTAMADAMGKTTAADVAAARLDNVSGSIEAMKGSVETLAINIGTALLPIIRGLADGVTTVANAFGSLDPKWQTAIATAGLVAVAVLGVAAALTAVAAAITMIDFASLFNPVTLVLAAVVVGILGFIAGLVALGIWLKNAYDKSEAFRGSIDSIIAKAKEVGDAIVQSWRDNVAPQLEKVQKIIDEKLKPAFQDFADVVRQKIQPVIEDFLQFFKDQAEPYMKAVANVIKDDVQPALENMAKFWQENKNWLGPVIQGIGILLGLLIAIPIALTALGALGAFKALASSFEFVTSAMRKVGDGINWIIDTAKKVPGWLSSLWGAITGFFSGALAWIQALPGRIMGFIASIPGAIANFVSGLIGQLAYMIGYGLGTVVSFIANLPANIVSILTSMWAWITNAFSTGVNAVVSFVSSLPERISSFFSSTWSRASSTTSSGISSIVSYVSSLPGRVLGFISDMKNRAVSEFLSLKDRLTGLGSDIINGVINGVKSAAGRLLDEVKSLANRIKQGFMDALKIGSPSKVMETDVGKWIPEGVAKGMMNNLAAVKRAVSATSDVLANGMAFDYKASVDASKAGSLGGYSSAAPTPVIVSPGGPSVSIGKVEAPQNMNPDEVATKVASRVMLGLATAGTGGR